MQKHVLTQEDLDNNPLLIHLGLKVGDEIKYPKSKKETGEPGPGPSTQDDDTGGPGPSPDTPRG